MVLHELVAIVERALEPESLGTAEERRVLDRVRAALLVQPAGPDTVERARCSCTLDAIEVTDEMEVAAADELEWRLLGATSRGTVRKVARAVLEAALGATTKGDGSL
jgi:hypothetical protein